MNIEVIKVENPDNKYQIVIGQGNFSIFTCDDLFKALLTTVPGIKCAVAMNEAIPRLTRVTGNDDIVQGLASSNCLNIGAGHVFVVMMKNAFPINVMNILKSHPAVVQLFVGTANYLEVLVVKTKLGSSVVGVVDGHSALRVEEQEEKRERRELCENLGYRIE